MTVGTMEERRTIVQPRTSCAMDAPMFLCWIEVLKWLLVAGLS